MNVEVTPEELLQAVASIAGQQFVSAVMAEAGRVKAMQELAALQAQKSATLQAVGSAEERAAFYEANS